MTSLNPILARWLDDVPLVPVDCGACARSSKCCDFQPFVPGFLVGAWLERGGRLPADEWRYRRQPLGLIPSARFRADRDRNVCAFYDRGRCGIWAYRPGECSAYSCAGENHAFAVRAFGLETNLSQMALIELGIPADAVAAQIDILNDPGQDLGHAADAEDIYRRSWAWARTLSRADIAAWLEEIT